jgi:hypothetical protein
VSPPQPRAHIRTNEYESKKINDEMLKCRCSWSHGLKVFLQLLEKITSGKTNKIPQFFCQNKKKKNNALMRIFLDDDGTLLSE